MQQVRPHERQKESMIRQQSNVVALKGALILQAHRILPIWLSKEKQLLETRERLDSR